MAIELVSEDLSWLATVHRPETTVNDHRMTRPFQLPAGVMKSIDSKGDEYVIDADFAIACGGGADVAVKGRVDLNNLVDVVPATDVLVWAAQTFFATSGLQMIQNMSLDALVRLADLPPPTLTRCPRCRGRLREPGADAVVGAHATTEDGRGCVSAAPCKQCDGYGRIANWEDGYMQIGPITVDRRGLTAIAKHLRGDQVALCVAPSHEGLGLDAHLRPYVEQQGKQHAVGGDWRVLWPAVVTPAPLPLVSA